MQSWHVWLALLAHLLLLLKSLLLLQSLLLKCVLLQQGLLLLQCLLLQGLLLQGRLLLLLLLLLLGRLLRMLSTLHRGRQRLWADLCQLKLVQRCPLLELFECQDLGSERGQLVHSEAPLPQLQQLPLLLLLLLLRLLLVGLLLGLLLQWQERCKLCCWLC